MCNDLGMNYNKCIGFEDCNNFCDNSHNNIGICKYWQIPTQTYKEGICLCPQGPKEKRHQQCIGEKQCANHAISEAISLYRCRWVHPRGNICKGPSGPKLIIDRSTAENMSKYIKNPVDNPIRGKILDKAKKVINGDRQNIYGDPENSFQIIADLWNVYYEHSYSVELGPKDVAMMMCLLKIARQLHQHKDDNLVDLAGYAALAGDMD